MNAVKNFFQRHFGGAGAPGADNDDGGFSTTALLWVLIGWLALWTLLPSLCIANVSIDIAENVAWGQNFDWGYDKNPYFGAWFTFAIFKALPTAAAEYVFYLVSQLAVLAGIMCAHLLARDIFKVRFPAFVAAALLLLIPLYSNSAYEFNDDMLSIPLYGLTALTFRRGVKRNAPADWLACGLCAGLALMTKYLAGVLLLPLGVLLVTSAEGRKCLTRPWIYLGALVCILLVLPNAVWLVRHDFIAFRYALERADLDKPRTWTLRTENFIDVWKSFSVRMILPLLALLFFRRGGKYAGIGAFDKRLVFTLSLAPIALSSLFALATGGQVMVPWTTPYYIFVTLLPVMLYRPEPGRRSLRIFAVFMATAALLMTVAFGYAFLYRRPYRQKRHCNHNVYPGRASAKWLTDEWRKRFGTPCPYVIGRRKVSCNFCYYSPDHPQAFFEHDLRLSPRIDPADVRKRGAVIVWQADEGKPPYLRQYAPRLIDLGQKEFARAIPFWMRPWAPPPPKHPLRAVLLPPEE